MSDSLPNRILTAARWLAAAAVFLATAEVFARVDDAVTWDAPLTGPYTNERLLVRDSAGIRGRPGYRFEKWKMNQAGFRGSELLVRPDSGTARVVVLGASETFGLYESEGLEYPARMQSLLDSLAPNRFEVINAALPGMMLTSMLPYYESVVAPLKPRYVLLYPTPVFSLFVTEPEPIASMRPAPRPPPIQPPAYRFSSRLAPKAREVAKGLVPPALLNVYREWRLGRVRKEHPTDWVWQTVPGSSMESFGRDLDRLVAAIRVSGAEPVLLTHTNRYLGCPECLEGAGRRHLVNLMQGDHPRASEQVMVSVDSTANEVVRAVARKYSVAVIEVEGRIPPSEIQFADYAHFTDAGAETMARLLTRALLQLRPPKP